MESAKWQPEMKLPEWLIAAIALRTCISWKAASIIVTNNSRAATTTLSPEGTAGTRPLYTRLPDLITESPKPWRFTITNCASSNRFRKNNPRVHMRQTNFFTQETSNSFNSLKQITKRPKEINGNNTRNLQEFNYYCRGSLRQVFGYDEILHRRDRNVSSDRKRTSTPM